MIVGKYTYGYDNIHIENSNQANLIIGSFCSIAQGLTIFLGGSHRSDWLTTYPFGHINKHLFTNFNGDGHPKTNGDVIIGNDVWIGYNSTIMSGVKIADGAIVAADSHVIQDVAPYSIVGGNPAKHIKFRFDPDIIEKLLEMKWWEWGESHININLPILCSGNIDELYQYYLNNII